MATTTRILDANVNGAVYTANANDALEALDTCHSGATAPTDEVANGKLWLDTSTTPGILKIYNNAAWEVVHSGTVDINGGAIDGTTIGGATPAAVTTSSLVATTADLNGGTIDGTVIGGATPAAGTFTALTSNGIDDNAAATAMTLDALGNVGIGTSLPEESLHVKGSIKVDFGSAGGNPRIYLDHDIATDDGNYLQLNRGDDGLEVVGQDNVKIRTNGSEAMRINSTGNVGIGTSSPDAKLMVSEGVNDTASALFYNTEGGSGSVQGKGYIGFGISEGWNFHGAEIGWDQEGVSGYRQALTFSTRENSDVRPTERMRIDSTGNLLLGTTDQFAYSTSTKSGVGLGSTGSMFSSAQNTEAAIFNRRSSTGSVVSLRNNGTEVGRISVTASSTFYNTTSDYRLKENITPVKGAADIVRAMRPCTYTFKSDGSWHDGFLAHELQELHPRAVTGEKDAMKDEEYEVTPAVYEDVIIPAVDAVAEVPAIYDEGVLVSDMVPAVEAQPERTEQHLVSEAVMGTRSVPDYQGVDYSKLTPILTAALQEALNKIDALEARVAALEP